MNEIIEYKITVSQNEYSVTGSISAEVVNDGKVFGIDAITEVENALRMDVIQENKIMYARKYNIPCHIDEDFDMSTMSKSELDDYTRLFATDEIIKDETIVNIEEIYKDN